MSTDNARFIRRFIDECANTGKAELLDQFVDANVVFHPLDPGQAPGIQGIKQGFGWFNSVFPGLHLEIDDLISEGPKVVVRWTFTGKQQGEFMGKPGTGQPVTYDGIDIYRISDGKIVEWWRTADTLSMLKQLGVIPG
jgi:predicted ester cyclase